MQSLSSCFPDISDQIAKTLPCVPSVQRICAKRATLFLADCRLIINKHNLLSIQEAKIFTLKAMLSHLFAARKSSDISLCPDLCCSLKGKQGCGQGRSGLSSVQIRVTSSCNVTLFAVTLHNSLT